jgi:serine/threonine protein kinase
MMEMWKADPAGAVRLPTSPASTDDRADSSGASDPSSTLTLTDGEVSHAPLDEEARFAPGTVLDDRYRIVALLGRGGMGEVYRADDLKLRLPVALKFLSAARDDDPELRSRLLHEVRIARRITHPNVCRVHDLGEHEGRLFLSMEYVDGENLGSLLRRIGHLPPDRAAALGRQLCAGLDAAHRQGIRHQDLKPSNGQPSGAPLQPSRNGRRKQRHCRHHRRLIRRRRPLHGIVGRAFVHATAFGVALFLNPNGVLYRSPG